MAEFALRVKTKNGQQILKNLNSNSTVLDLKQQLSKLSNIPVNCLHVLSGFPPKVFDISRENLALKDSGLCSGDTLILEEKAASLATPPAQPPQHQKLAARPPPAAVDNDDALPGILMKKIVPADNSCLFTSINFVISGKLEDSTTVAPYMRKIIAETVSNDRETFSEAMLGKSNPDYCAWILDDKSWGGAIELMILSNYYGIEIAVVDTINTIINRFGEDQHYPHRVFLLFDGIHYDPLYFEPYDGSEIRTIFPSEDERYLKEAQQLAIEANSSRQFTDVNKFTLKCLVCNIHLNGQVQAREHAQSTGHANFGEV